jgi:CBS domain-containing protein
VLATSSSVYDACGAFFNGDFKAIPVVHKEKPLGVVTRAGLLRSLLNASVLGGRQVMNFMSSPVVSIDERSSVAQARARMRREHVGRLAVLRGAKLAGIITNYDIAGLDVPKEKPPFVREKAGLSEQPVASYMSGDVVTIHPDATLAEAAQQMLGHGISSLIVTSDAEPVGVLTTQDVFEALLEAEQRNIYVTGLAEDEGEYKGVILNACGELLDRVEKSFTVEYVVVHVKRHEENGKRKYSVRVRLKTPERIIAVKSFKWGLPQAVADALDELKHVMLQKLKRKPAHADRMEQFEEGGRER